MWATHSVLALWVCCALDLEAELLGFRACDQPAKRISSHSTVWFHTLGGWPILANLSRPPEEGRSRGKKGGPRRVGEGPKGVRGEARREGGSEGWERGRPEGEGSPERWLGRPEGWEGGPEGWEEGPIFRFFPLSHHNCHSFLPSLGGLLVEFWWCFEALGTLLHVWALGLSCEAPAAKGPD